MNEVEFLKKYQRGVLLTKLALKEFVTDYRESGIENTSIAEKILRENVVLHCEHIGDTMVNQTGFLTINSPSNQTGFKRLASLKKTLVTSPLTNTFPIGIRKCVAYINYTLDQLLIFQMNSTKYYWKKNFRNHTAQEIEELVSVYESRHIRLKASTQAAKELHKTLVGQLKEFARSQRVDQELVKIDAFNDSLEVLPNVEIHPKTYRGLAGLNLFTGVVDVELPNGKKHTLHVTEVLDFMRKEMI
jgi:hypothetical protein